MDGTDGRQPRSRLPGGRPATARPSGARPSGGGGAVVAVLLGLVVAVTSLVGLSTRAWGSPDAFVSRALQVVDDGWPGGTWPPDGWPDGTRPDGRDRSGMWPPGGWPDGVWPDDARSG